MWDKHGDKTEGFVTGGTTGAGTQVNWDDLHRPTADEIFEVFRTIHTTAFPALEPLPIPSDPNEGGLFSHIFSCLFN